MKFKGRSTDDWGNVIFESDGLIDHLMRGHDIARDMTALTSPSVEKFNNLCQEWDHPEDKVGTYRAPDVTVEEWDGLHQSQWFTPEPYASMDVFEYVVEKCTTEQQVMRVLEEWAIYEERDMIPILKQMIYMIDMFRKENIVWGVGRGSSVASYILFLIGVHKVDSIAFDLDIREFLK